VLIHYSQHRVVVNEDLENDGKIPAPLNLPFGKLFFGFNIPPYVPPSAPEDEPAPKVRVHRIIGFWWLTPIEPPTTFGGTGNTLNGRAASTSAQSTGKGKSKATEDTEVKKADGPKWGTGQGRSLGSRSTNGAGTRTFGAGLIGAGGASVPRLPQRSGKKPPRRSPTPDFGIDDDDVIVIDSDVD
jgi:ubiquitin fusion degradation protein 1